MRRILLLSVCHSRDDIPRQGIPFGMLDGVMNQCMNPVFADEAETRAS